MAPGTASIAAGQECEERFKRLAFPAGMASDGCQLGLHWRYFGLSQCAVGNVESSAFLPGIQILLLFRGEAIDPDTHLKQLDSSNLVVDIRGNRVHGVF